MLKSYLKQDNVAPPLPNNFILFELDFDIKFPLLHLLLFLSDLKSTIFCIKNWKQTFLKYAPLRNCSHTIFHSNKI